MINNGKPRRTVRHLSSTGPEPLDRSIQWAILAALATCVAYLVVLVFLGMLHNMAPDVWMLIGRLIACFAIALPILLAGRLWWTSRIIQERSFAWFGFCATFFGLAVLVVFFLQLTVQTWAWFRTMPVLIEQENQQLLGQVDAKLEEEKSKLHKELQSELARAGSEEEKKEVRELFEKEVIPERMKQLEQSVAEWKVEAEQGVRQDMSAAALLGYFLLQGPSNKPQDAGIYPALLGTLWLALITFLFAVPVGVGAALYLEEYRHTNWLGNAIQININNLAGVPSVVYGILGAFVFVELIFKPLENMNSHIAARNVLGGGLTLGLLTLPVVIVAAQEAIRAVPSSIRQGAYALGATRWQVIWHQVLPMARPGILTGTILALSRAMGEAAPLILFGALLFVNQDPTLFSRFTILPMQIFNWVDRPAVTISGKTVEVWHYNAALASLVLLAALLTLNGLAIYLRYRAQRHTRW